MTIHTESPQPHARPTGKVGLGFYWDFELVRGDHAKRIGVHPFTGEPLRNEKWRVHNALLDSGEQNLLDLYFRNQNAPPNFFLGLHSGSLVETSTLANIVEPSQSGYARIQLSRNTTDWPTLALDAGDFQAESLQKTFTAAATWTPVNKLFLASQSAAVVGALLLEADLSTLRSLVSQDQLNVTVRAKAQ